MIHADATNRVLPDQCADLVYLCTVLGEIPDRAAALANCFAVLRPGGRLSITEIKGDPHFQSRATLDSLTPRRRLRAGKRDRQLVALYGQLSQAVK